MTTKKFTCVFEHKKHDNMKLRVDFAIDKIDHINFLIEIKHYHSTTSNTFNFDLPSWLNLTQYQLKNVDHNDLNRAYTVDNIDLIFLLSTVFIVADQSNYRLQTNLSSKI